MIRAHITLTEKQDKEWKETHRYRILEVLATEVKDQSVAIYGEVTRVENYSWDCLHCGEPHAYESYVVHDALWLSTGWAKNQGACHLRCFEQKIGRRITMGDLKDVPWNNLLKHLLSMEVK